MLIYSDRLKIASVVNVGGEAGGSVCHSHEGKSWNTHTCPRRESPKPPHRSQAYLITNKDTESFSSFVFYSFSPS